MIKIIADDIFLNGKKVGEITVGTSTDRDTFVEILERDLEDIYTHSFTIQCPECEHEWTDTFYE
jgi:hypothetical protein